MITNFNFNGEKLTYDPSPGEHIEKTINNMSELAKDHGINCEAEFNEIPIIVNPDDEIRDAVNRWYEELNKREEEYKKSPEYEKRQIETEIKRCEQKKRIEYLLENKPNFDNFNSVISWLEEVEKCDMIGLSKYEILNIFKEKGYLPNVNCYENFEEGNEENEARWLIGQGLEFIESFGSIHQIYPSFAEKWRKMYGYEKVNF